MTFIVRWQRSAFTSICGAIPRVRSDVARASMRRTTVPDKTLRGEFYVQFKRSGNTMIAQKLTQSRSKTPRGSGAVSIRLRIDAPSWVFDPLDLVADTIVPAENTEPVIRLSSLGPDLATPDSTT